jgi:tRNA (cytidine/uridine-2'-O-)-methyltransferase
MKIVLFQPQIPQNTGNIVRTCSVSGADLVLVKPLGFSINDKYLKRAGLDYWEEVNIEIIDNLEKYLEETHSSFYFFSSRATKFYTDVQYKPSDLLIFGSETDGLHPVFFEKHPEKFLKVPMKKNSRCLNLSNTVSIVLYEAWRQQGFI